jgi:chromosome segregation ATPase
MSSDILDKQFALIETLKRSHDSEFTNTLLQQNIVETSQRVRHLETIESQLSSQIENLEAELTELQAENDALDVTFQVPANTIQGDFFDQLRAIERNRDHLQGELSGLRAVRKRIDSELHSYELKAHRLQQELESLNIEHNSITTDLRVHSDEVVHQRAILKQLNAELDSQVSACSDLRTLVLGKYKEQKESNAEALSVLLTLKERCEAQLREKRAQIQRLTRMENDIRQTQAIRQKLAQKDAEKTQSAANWIGERDVLAAKIRKAQDELTVLNRRVKGAIRSSTKVANRWDELGFETEEAKIAVMREIREVEKDWPAFLVHTLQSELMVEEELKSKLKDLERTQIEIGEFQKGVFQILNQQKENSMIEPRLTVLRNELSFLRAIQ